MKNPHLVERLKNFLIPDPQELIVMCVGSAINTNERPAAPLAHKYGFHDLLDHATELLKNSKKTSAAPQETANTSEEDTVTFSYSPRP